MIYIKSLKNAGGYDANGNRYIIIDIVCDTETDLPAPSYFIDREPLSQCIIFQSSTAEIINTGAKFEMQSNGTWILKQAGTATYTKSEIDTMLSTINATNAAQQKQIDYNTDTGSKNKLHTLRSSGTSTTGLSYTLNSDGTYSLGGVTTANANISSLCTLADIPADFIGKNVILSGAVDSNIRLSLYNGNTQTQYTDTGNGVEFEITAEMISNPYTIRLLVNSGTDCNGKTIKPMLRIADIINGDFEPYAPTNRQLYEMILAMQ